MTDQTGEIGSDDWQRLITAREMYTRSAGIHYDEVLDQVAQRARSEGSIGKTDIGALLLFKRLRGDTSWARALMTTADTAVRQATAAAPHRVAVYDRRAHTSLHSLGIPLTHAAGRYSCYIAALDDLLSQAPFPPHTRLDTPGPGHRPVLPARHEPATIAPWPDRLSELAGRSLHADDTEAMTA
ncbi:hypothetical protein ACWDU3_35170 [Streptomyces olivaceus]